MRFVAPARTALSPGVERHPALHELLAFEPDLFGSEWPSVESLNRLPRIQHRLTGQPIRFVEQNPSLLADGLHYEQRIVQSGLVATRPENWHDLFNALMWRRFSSLKSAVNWRYTREFPAGVGQERSRPQMALTHFDEAGILVITESEALLDSWDTHDWPAVFGDDGNGWTERARVHVFGHALLEHCLEPHLLLVGKAIVVRGDLADPSHVEWFGDLLARGQVLTDPLELRPLPLSGIPGWFAGQDPQFYRTADCFRPLRSGRQYPRPLVRE